MFGLVVLFIFLVGALFAYGSRRAVRIGETGERKVAFFLNLNLDNRLYRIFNNILVPDKLGGTTQIDHIVLSPFGIFVIETKNFKGWIFGAEKSKMWTKQFFHERYQFYNPIRQNYKHITCLAEYTHLSREYFSPVVVFVGNCSLKTINELPEYVCENKHSMICYIRSRTVHILDDDTLARLHLILQRLAKNSHEAYQDHVEHVCDLVSGQTSRTIPRCPRCGREMVERQAKIGKNAGKKFWGCSNYPYCHGTIDRK